VLAIGLPRALVDVLESVDIVDHVVALPTGGNRPLRAFRPGGAIVVQLEARVGQVTGPGRDDPAGPGVADVLAEAARRIGHYLSAATHRLEHAEAARLLP